MVLLGGPFVNLQRNSSMSKLTSCLALWQAAILDRIDVRTHKFHNYLFVLSPAVESTHPFKTQFERAIKILNFWLSLTIFIVLIKLLLILNGYTIIAISSGATWSTLRQPYSKWQPALVIYNCEYWLTLIGRYFG